MLISKKYVIITAARNEEAYIEETIRSVISQTILPIKWVIVSDSSTDRTDEIINKYSAKYKFIELLRAGQSGSRNFGSKVGAINAGYKLLPNTAYEFLGILDADVAFEANYYEGVLAKFNENNKLGIAGGIIIDVCDGNFNKKYTNPESVSGAIQLFRRQCYEQIGGYIPLEAGGIDTVAEIMARMAGWQTQSFPEFKVFHHRRMGTEGRSIYLVRFLQGKEDYLLGYHHLFFILKCVYRVIERPYLVGSLFMISGYCWSCLHKGERQVSADFIRYLRKEQINRLRSLFTTLKR